MRVQVVLWGLEKSIKDDARWVLCCNCKGLLAFWSNLRADVLNQERIIEVFESISSIEEIQLAF